NNSGASKFSVGRRSGKGPEQVLQLRHDEIRLCGEGCGNFSPAQSLEPFAQLLRRQPVIPAFQDTMGQSSDQLGNIRPSSSSPGAKERYRLTHPLLKGGRTGKGWRRISLLLASRSLLPSCQQ